MLRLPYLRYIRVYISFFFFSRAASVRRLLQNLQVKHFLKFALLEQIPIPFSIFAYNTLFLIYSLSVYLFQRLLQSSPLKSCMGVKLRYSIYSEEFKRTQIPFVHYFILMWCPNRIFCTTTDCLRIFFYKNVHNIYF